MSMHSITRRDFVRLGAGAVAAGTAIKSTLLEPPVLAAQAAAGDASGRKIRFVSIGTGIRGCDLLRSARQVPTGVLVGTADLYDMHQKAGLEAYGADVPTSRDYRSLLDRKDVDAVFVAVSDHLHRRVVLDAIAAGKDVYCEKPMSHNVADGLAMVDAVQSNKRILQVGSQRVSNLVYKKAAEIYTSGRLGEVHLIEGHTDRNSPSGAWVYPVAPDASPQTIDWEAFLRDAPERPFDAVRFFRWRCFADYGEGLAGDLFVHLISGIQGVSGINAAPNRACSSGSLTHFADGRDFPDLLATLYDYPGITVSLHCNQNNSGGDETVFYGKEATMVISGNTLTVTPQDTRPEPEGYSLDGWTAAAKKQYLNEWHAANPAPPAKMAAMESYSAPGDYDDTADHIANFFRAVETREHVVEDEVFGNHAAIACHMANYSYFHHSVATWDAATQSIKG
jgi:predicted dehydrogenase